MTESRRDYEIVEAFLGQWESGGLYVWKATEAKEALARIKRDRAQEVVQAKNDEREACARLLDGHVGNDEARSAVVRACAAAIRAQGVTSL